MRQFIFVLTMAFAGICGTSALAASLDSHLGVGLDDLVTLQWECNVGTPTRLLRNGERIEDFTIPRNRALVITDVEWRVSVIDGGTGENFIGELHLTDGSGLASFPYLAFVPLLQTRGYLADHLTGGLVVDATVALDNGALTHPRLTVFGVAPGAPGLSACHLILRGYLARP